MCTSSASSAAAMMTKFRQAAEIGESKEPAWVGPSAPTRPARSMAKRTGRLLDRDVVHDLVVGALQEGRIDRANGL
jgi:hypothetical protein